MRRTAICALVFAAACTGTAHEHAPRVELPPPSDTTTLVARERTRKALLDEWRHVFAELGETGTGRVTDYTFPDASEYTLGSHPHPHGSNARASEDSIATRDVRNRLRSARTTVTDSRADRAKHTRAVVRCADYCASVKRN